MTEPLGIPNVNSFRSPRRLNFLNLWQNLLLGRWTRSSTDRNSLPNQVFRYVRKRWLHKIYSFIPPASIQIRGRGGFVLSRVTTFHCTLNHCLSALNTKMMQLITAIPYSYHCCNLLHPRRMYPQGNNKRFYNATKLIISAASRSDAYGNDREYHGKSVDESMVVLRKKIHEVKITEANCETPDEWMEWEKRYYCERYASDVCEAVGVLQSLLINARPSFALGMAAIIALSIPLSAGVIIFRLVEVTMWLAAGIRL